MNRLATLRAAGSSLTVPGTCERSSAATVLSGVLVLSPVFVPKKTMNRTIAAATPLVVMAAAAAEATIGLAIVIAIYRNRKTPLVDEYDAMRQ